MKNLKNFNAKSLSRNDLASVNGGLLSSTQGYQCCNQWGCGTCVTGSNEDCSIYGSEAYGQSCTVSGGSIGIK